LKLKIFTLKFSPSTEGFNDQPLQEFIVDKEVIDFTDHFFIHEKIPYLLILLSYRHISQGEKRMLNRRQDPYSALDAREKEAYDALKAWRAARAKQEGIPPYMIANNKQIARMITQKAMIKADFDKISGFGEAKIAKYGQDILSALAKYLRPDSIKKSEISKIKEEPEQ